MRVFDQNQGAQTNAELARLILSHFISDHLNSSHIKNIIFFSELANFAHQQFYPDRLGTPYRRLWHIAPRDEPHFFIGRKAGFIMDKLPVVE